MIVRTFGPVRFFAFDRDGLHGGGFGSEEWYHGRCLSTQVLCERIDCLVKRK